MKAIAKKKISYYLPKLLPLHLLLPLLLPACTTAPKILDYISLPPPDNVQARIIDDRIEVTWKMPKHISSKNITGFNVYLSPVSLMYTAYADLPAPAATKTASETNALLQIPESEKTIFIHVRSKNLRGDLSLPSLPEVMLEVGSDWWGVKSLGTKFFAPTFGIYDKQSKFFLAHRNRNLTEKFFFSEGFPFLWALFLVGLRFTSLDNYVDNFR